MFGFVWIMKCLVIYGIVYMEYKQLSNTDFF